MPPPFPQLAPPDRAPKARAITHTLPQPSLPWGAALIVLATGLILLQI